MSPVADLPSRAEIVVVGGGVIGASVAYHLTKLGKTDVLLLEQGHLSGGTTWHAAGLVGPLRASESGTRLVQYSAELYAALEAETGLATGYRNVGGVIVARTEDRMVQLRRTAANAAAYDMECEVVSPQRAQELWPVMQVDDLLGALWLPGDGKVNPTDLTQSLAKGARMGGAKVVEKARVTGFTRRRTARHRGGDRPGRGRVRRGGQLRRPVGQGAVDRAKVGVTVPLHSCEHFYVVTEAVEGTHPDLPIMRDPDGWTYFKEEVGGLVVGGFEPEAKPWRSPDDLPHPFEFQLLDEDWEHFSVLMDEAVHRVPVLAETGIRKFYNGPESFTPDNQFLLGRAPELDNCFVGAGFNSVGIASAGGAGRALAEWVVAGEATSRPDRRRRTPVRGVQRGQHVAARPGRRDPGAALRPALAEPGAGHRARRPPVAGALAGGCGRCDLRLQDGLGAAERLRADARRRPRLRVGQAVLAALVRGRAARDPAGGRRLRPDVVLEVRRSRAVRSRGAAVGLRRRRRRTDRALRLHAVAQRPRQLRGRPHGHPGRADCFWVVSSSATTVRDLDWLRRHGGVEGGDVTDAFAVLGVMGPASRDLLGRISSDDWSEDGFPFATSRTATVAGVPLRATRMTYVGELGWELTVPVRGAGTVYDALFGEGADLGVSNAGYYTIDSLRLEKGFRAFPRELSPDYTPVEAGLVFATALKTDKPFLGREALEAQRDRLAEGGPRRRLVSFVVEDPAPMLWGGELLLRDGRPAGQVTSAAWGETVGASVGLAYLRSEGPVTSDSLADGRFEVDVAGERFGVRLSLKAPLA